MSADITFRCDRCGQNLVIDAAGIGVDVECPTCHQPLRVPPTTPKTETPVADFHELLSHPIKRVQQAVRHRQNETERKKLRDALGKTEGIAQKAVQRCEPVVVNLESRLARGEPPTLLESCTLIEEKQLLRDTSAWADHLLYSNLIGDFLGSVRESLTGVTQENPNDKRIGILTPLIDKWTRIKAAGPLRESSYSDFLTELARISDEHPSSYSVVEGREIRCGTLSEVQRIIEDLHDKPEIERRLRVIKAPLLSLCERIDRLGYLTPTSFQEFVGQDRAKERLEIAIEASRRRGEALPHMLLVGPRGTGKATLAYLVARMMDVNVFATPGEEIRSGGVIIRPDAEAGGGFVVLVEDVERVRPSAREHMLRFINLPHWTLIGTTTHMERLSDPVLSRFSSTLEFTKYARDELVAIGQRFAIGLGLELDQPALAELAKRSDGTPRGVLNSLRHVKDYALVKSESPTITAETVAAALGPGVAGQEGDESAQDRRAIPSSVRMEVWRRDGGKCAKCGGREKLEYDHIIPISKGGSNTARNIELLCENCNRSKSNRIA